MVEGDNNNFRMRERILNQPNGMGSNNAEITFTDALKEVIRRFGPSCLAFQDNIILLINFLFIGFLNDSVALSACGLAVFTIDVTIVSIGKGL